MAEMQSAKERIARNRALAQAMQEQALSSGPLVHRNEGYAKLVKALVGSQINKFASQNEKAMEERQRQAMAHALSGTIPGARPGQPGIAQGRPDEPPSIFNQVSQPMLNRQQQSAVQALPFEMQQQILAEKILQTSSPQNIETVNFGRRDPVTNAFTPIVSTTEGSPEYYQAIEDGLVMTGPGRQAGYERTEEVTDWRFGKRVDEATDIQTSYKQAAAGVDNLALTIAAAGDKALSFTGAVSNVTNSFFAQAQAFAKTATARAKSGVRAYVEGKGLLAEVNGEVVPESQLLNPANYGAFFKKTGVMQQAARDRQRIMTQSLKLAYAMARADDPGGRLSDRDVQIQLERLGLSQGDHRVTLSALYEVRQAIDRDAKIALETLSTGPEGVPRYDFKSAELPPQLQTIYSDPVITGGSRSVPEAVVIDGQVYSVKDLEGKYIEEGGQVYRYINGRKVPVQTN